MAQAQSTDLSPCPTGVTLTPCGHPKHGMAQASGGVLVHWPMIPVCTPKKGESGIEIECCNTNRVFLQTPDELLYQFTCPVSGYVHFKNTDFNGQNFFTYMPKLNSVFAGTHLRTEKRAYIVCQLTYGDARNLLSGRVIRRVDKTGYGDMWANTYTTTCGHNAANILYGSLGYGATRAGSCWAVNMCTDLVSAGALPKGVRETLFFSWAEEAEPALALAPVPVPVPEPDANPAHDITRLTQAHFAKEGAVDMREQYMLHFKVGPAGVPTVWQCIRALATADLTDIVLGVGVEQPKEQVPGSNNGHTAGREIDPYDREYRGSGRAIDLDDVE